MNIKLYPICADRGIWSFREQPGTEPVRVRVPAGSYTKEIPGLGLELFVPAEGDPLQKIRWHANHVIAEARKGGRFTEVRSRRAGRVA